MNEVALHTDQNKMSIQNLATVLGPNMLRPVTETAETLVGQAGAVNAVALELIRHVHTLFLSHKSFQTVTRLDEVEFVGVAKAVYAYSPPGGNEHQEEISVESGDILFIHYTSSFTSFDEHGWWTADVVGKNERKTGLVPSNYLEILHREPVERFVRRTSNVTVKSIPPPLDIPVPCTLDASTQTDLNVDNLVQRNDELELQLRDLKQEVWSLEQQLKQQKRRSQILESAQAAPRSSPPSSPVRSNSPTPSTDTILPLRRRRPAPAPPAIRGKVQVRASSLFLEEFLQQKITRQQEMFRRSCPPIASEIPTAPIDSLVLSPPPPLAIATSVPALSPLDTFKFPAPPVTPPEML
jgi:hypothetical protein